MALRIVKASDPVKVKQLNLCIYAGPGVGKTTMSFTADDPLLLDFDRGVHRAKNRKDSVPIEAWSDVNDLTEESLAPYKSIIVDTAGRALDKLTADIIKADAKAGRRDGSLTLQGYGTLKTRFSAWLKQLNTFGKDVILIAHMDEQRNGDDVIERLDVQGGSKGEIYKSVDAMGRIFVKGKERVIDFSPRENAFGKNPCGLDVVTFPDPDKEPHFLGKLLSTMKEKLNQAADAQMAEQQTIDSWRDALKDMTKVEEINQMLPQIKGRIGVKAAVQERAKELGFTFNRSTLAYEAKEDDDVLSLG